MKKSNLILAITITIICACFGMINFKLSAEYKKKKILPSVKKVILPPFHHIKEIKKLFVHEIVCIEDGQVFAKGYQELEKRYLELKEMYGNWGVVLQKQTISENGLTVTIQYELVTEKAGIFHVVSILHMSKDQKISVVDESYYRVDTELDDD